MQFGKYLGFFALAASVIVLGACGGGGGTIGGDRAPTQQTRDAVRMTQASGIRAMLSGGGQTFGQAESANGFGGGGGTTGGGGFGIPMIGAFMQKVAIDPSFRELRSRNGDPDAGTTGGGGILPGDEFPTFYYDEYLGLWVDLQITETSISFLLYEDEAKAKTAGSVISQWPSDWRTYPQSYVSTFEFTAGAYAGSHGRYETILESESNGRSSYEAFWKGSHDVGTSTWSEVGTQWTNRFENAEGYWSQDSGTFRADGSGVTASENSLGYKTHYEYFADGSARGVIEGPDPGLPATITWDSKGHVVVTYADGTSEEWDWWTICSDIVEGDVSGGTTGSGGGVEEKEDRR